jgi:hypothetical protein
MSVPDGVTHVWQLRIKHAPWQRDVCHGTVRAVSVKDAALQRRLQAAVVNHVHLRWRGFFVLAKVVATAEESSFGDDNRHVIKAGWLRTLPRLARIGGGPPSRSPIPIGGSAPWSPTPRARFQQIGDGDGGASPSPGRANRGRGRGRSPILAPL